MQDKFPTDTSHYKLIISDFDGTMAGVDHVATDKVTEAVNAWIQSGRFFSIATGRQYLMIKEECKRIGITTPVVVRGGAEVVDPISDKILFAEYIEKSDVEKILFALERKDIAGYGIEDNDTIFSNFEILISFPLITFKKVTEFQLKRVPKIHVKPRNGKDNETEKMIDKISSSIPGINAIATHNSQFGKGWDITSVKATKLFGVVKVMELLNINREDIVGVGDSYNDFPLLQAAGLKVAMGNANDELKEIADAIIPSNGEDGVAYLINKLLENSKS